MLLTDTTNEPEEAMCSSVQLCFTSGSSSLSESAAGISPLPAGWGRLQLTCDLVQVFYSKCIRPGPRETRRVLRAEAGSIAVCLDYDLFHLHPGSAFMVFLKMRLWQLT